MSIRPTSCAAACAALLAVAAGAQTTRPTSRPTSRPAAGETNPAAPGFDAEGSDAAAIELADATMAAMGGRAAWDRTRFLRWSFFGVRKHVWDKHTGDIRVEGTEHGSGEPYVILMNLHTRAGRAWRGGAEVTDEAALAALLEAGEARWINDAYWLVMPYKLKDSGVTLRAAGAAAMEDGRAAQVLELTFDGVGRTPQNKYRVFIADDSGLVEQWQFFAKADDTEPTITTPWRGWARHGEIMLCGDRGEMRGRPARLEDIAVFDELPRSLFERPDPVDWDAIGEGTEERD